jgi:hypothetical protein
MGLVVQCIANQLKEGLFLERIDLQDLRNCVESWWQAEGLAGDGDRQVEADGNPDLGDVPPAVEIRSAGIAG